jgi:tol-pal system protein YbgF
MLRATAVAGLVVLVLSGCATRSSVRQVAADVTALRSELALLRQTQDALAVQVGDLAASMKTSRASVDGLQRALTTAAADVARVTARLDAAEHAIKEVRESMAAQAAAAAAPPVPTPAAPPAAVAAAVPGPPRESHGASAESSYAAALASFRAREYGQAILDFLDVALKYPRHPLAPSAQFWIGEAYYRQHDYRQALTEFQKVVEWEAPNPKVADAWLKVGLCYGNLREQSRALEAWRRVVRDFPDSPAATEARRLLASAWPSTRR